MAAVALIAQNTSDAISGLALRFLSAEADKEYTSFLHRTPPVWADDDT